MVAIHHGIHPPSSGQLQQVRKGCFPYSAYSFSAISNLFERWGVDLDFLIIPWSTSQINAKFQEMIPCRPWEVLFHHGSFSCQILSHDSVSVIVSRFTSLNQERLGALLLSILRNFAAQGMASPVRLLHGVQEVLALLHFAISVFQEVSVNSFPVTPFLMATQAVTGLPVLVRRLVTRFVTGLLVLVHSYYHFVLLLDTK